MIWLVFGTLRGTEQPDSIVMIGSHRDAMTFGAIDPGSGTTVLLQDADALRSADEARLETETARSSSPRGMATSSASSALQRISTKMARRSGRTSSNTLTPIN